MIHNKNPRLFTLLTALGISFCQTLPATEELHFQYLVYSNLFSDIYEHIPVLRELSSHCESVVEIGVREGYSTWGILFGLSENEKRFKSYIGIDLNTPPDIHFFTKLANESGIACDFWKVNDMEIQIPLCDMLFIDSLHTYCHLTYELETFSSRVRKYISLHDTDAPWGHCDDTSYSGNYAEYPKHYDRSKKGLWPAVEDFLKRHPEWSLKERRSNNCGFTILERVD